MAKASGRRSAADRVRTDLPGITPPRKLTTAERKVWRRVTAAWPADHFVDSDGHLLAAYCRIVVAFDGLNDIAELNATAKTIAALATKLRITPQSRVHRHAAGSAADAGRDAAPGRHALIGGAEWDEENNSLH